MRLLTKKGSGVYGLNRSVRAWFKWGGWGERTASGKRGRAQYREARVKIRRGARADWWVALVHIMTYKDDISLLEYSYSPWYTTNLLSYTYFELSQYCCLDNVSTVAELRRRLDWFGQRVWCNFILNNVRPGERSYSCTRKKALRVQIARVCLFVCTAVYAPLAL